MLYTPEICDGVYFVGVKDFNRRIFDALIPLPRGTSYNSYLVTGTEKNALIDTVNILSNSYQIFGVMASGVVGVTVCRKFKYM